MIDSIKFSKEDIDILIAAVSLAITFIMFLYQVPQIRREVKKLKEEQKKAESSTARLNYIRQVSNENGLGIWSKSVDFRKLDYQNVLAQSIPVIMMANLKGGVGKTTISANLAAALADKSNEIINPGKQTRRVLVIDLDYQGSLSSLFLGHSQINDAREYDNIQKKGVQLLSGNKNASWAKEAAQSLNEDYFNLKYLPTNSEMADLENRLFLKWLIGDTEYIRFNLFNILSQPEIQNSFDYIIIDTAPRFTVAFINAMCCSTHLLIPTALDNLSALSVGDFLGQYRYLQRRVCTHLDLIGVIGSMSFHQEPGAYTAAERSVIETIEHQIRKAYNHGDYFLSNCNIRRDAAIKDAAGSRLAYFESEHVRNIFTEIAKTVLERTRK